MWFVMKTPNNDDMVVIDGDAFRSTSYLLLGNLTIFATQHLFPNS
jgi:hypothetical protein